MPLPAIWALRPVNIAALVGEHMAVVWKRLYNRPPLASLSSAGVGTGPPKVEDEAKPTSSVRMISILGDPDGAVAGWG